MSEKTHNPLGAVRQIEAAKLLSVTPNTLRRWAAAGKIIVHRPNGGAVLIPVSEVERLGGKAVH